MLARAHNGRLSAFYIALGDAPLARVHYIIGTQPGAVPQADRAALEAAIAQAARGFGERLAEALAAGQGEAEADRRLARWRAPSRRPIARPPPRRRAWPTCRWRSSPSKPGGRAPKCCARRAPARVP